MAFDGPDEFTEITDDGLSENGDQPAATAATAGRPTVASAASQVAEQTPNIQAGGSRLSLIQIIKIVIDRTQKSQLKIKIGDGWVDVTVIDGNDPPAMDQQFAKLATVLFAIGVWGPFEFTLENRNNLLASRRDARINLDEDYCVQLGRLFDVAFKTVAASASAPAVTPTPVAPVAPVYSTVARAGATTDQKHAPLLQASSARSRGAWGDSKTRAPVSQAPAKENPELERAVKTVWKYMSEHAANPDFTSTKEADILKAHNYIISVTGNTKRPRGFLEAVRQRIAKKQASNA